MKQTTVHNQHILSGWSLTGLLSILLVSNVVATIFLFDINEKETVSVLIRSTSKLSFVLFMFAFAASSLHYYSKNTFTNWLIANRRYVGVAFAISHYIHLGMLILMTVHINFNVFEDRGLFKTAFGATAYAFITLMTITSFDQTRILFGASNWKRIHIIGGYFLWVIFAKSYILEMTNPIRILFAIVAVVVLLLRISIFLKRK